MSTLDWTREANLTHWGGLYGLPTIYDSLIWVLYRQVMKMTPTFPKNVYSFLDVWM